METAVSARLAAIATLADGPSVQRRNLPIQFESISAKKRTMPSLQKALFRAMLCVGFLVAEPGSVSLAGLPKLPNAQVPKFSGFSFPNAPQFPSCCRVPNAPQFPNFSGFSFPNAPQFPDFSGFRFPNAPQFPSCCEFPDLDLSKVDWDTVAQDIEELGAIIIAIFGGSKKDQGDGDAWVGLTIQMPDGQSKQIWYNPSNSADLGSTSYIAIEPSTGYRFVVPSFAITAAEIQWETASNSPDQVDMPQMADPPQLPDRPDRSD